MIKTKEFTELTGVSVRTLHYYDEIGLLEPCVIDGKTGYRYYNNESVMRMQEILFFREVGFSLKEVREIIDSPDYERKWAFEELKKLLLLKKNRLENLIMSIDDAIKGRNVMGNFSNKEELQYKKNLKMRWKKGNGNGKGAIEETEYNVLDPDMEMFVKEFNLYMIAGMEPRSMVVQEMVMSLKHHITANYYVCTEEVLRNLAKKFGENEIYRKSVNKCGAGVADFISEAIKIYCDSN